MQGKISVCIIGDFNRESREHNDTNLAFSHVAKWLGVPIETQWVDTLSLADRVEKKLQDYDAFLCAPGSPYKSMNGALNGIRFARETDSPFLGTCGGFQYTVIEYARNVMSVKDADHEEEHPNAHQLFITRLSCSLVGRTQRIHIKPGSHAYDIYGTSTTEERLFCSFGLNPAIREGMEDAGLRASGFDDNGEVRIIELSNARFFLATLFVPQACSTEDRPHPLALSIVKTAMKQDLQERKRKTKEKAA